MDEPLKPPHGLNRSGLACWFSLMHLIKTRSPCYLWTATAPEVVPDHWFSRAHMRFLHYVALKARDRWLPLNWGGVRVIEEHPGGHGLHSHLVLAGWMDWHTMKECAERAGLGRLHVDPQKVTARAAGYLCKYLTKGPQLKGIRRWACVGSFDGELARTIEFDSQRVRDIKAIRDYLVQMCGWQKYPAYLFAVRRVATKGDPWTKEELTPF